MSSREDFDYDNMDIQKKCKKKEMWNKEYNRNNDSYDNDENLNEDKMMQYKKHGKWFQARSNRLRGSNYSGLFVFIIVIVSIMQLAFICKTHQDFMQGNSQKAEADFQVVLIITYAFLALGILSFILDRKSVV